MLWTSGMNPSFSFCESPKTRFIPYTGFGGLHLLETGPWFSLKAKGTLEKVLEGEHDLCLSIL